MVHKVVSTFNPHEFADIGTILIFENLRRAGVEVDVLPDCNFMDLEGILATYKERLDGADMVFHIPAVTHYLFSKSKGHHWTSDECDRIRNIEQQLDEHIRHLGDSGTILSLNLNEEREVHTTLDEIGLPRIRRMTVQEWKAYPFFPAVFKWGIMHGGQGIYIIDTEDQFRKMFERGYGARLVNGQIVSSPFIGFEDSFNVSEFIICPSDHYTHYRIFTLGDGTILGAVLSYSQSKKGDDIRVIEEDSETSNVLDNPHSPLFLNRRKIVSNLVQGGIQIPLNPNKNSRDINNYERGLLREHGITEQKIPPKLAEQVTCAARALGDKGLYVSGQDWIQGIDGNFYFLEVNPRPGYDIFDTLYNHGRSDAKIALRLAAEKIADGILAHLDRKLTVVRLIKSNYFIMQLHQS